jgi:hypothetical protein
MAADGPTEKELLLLEHALRSAKTPLLYAPIPDLPSVLQELSSWLADEHQWRSAKASNWTSLLGDLISSWENLGPSLQKCLDDDTKREIDEVEAVRKGMRRGNHLPDESTRRRLERATQKIKSGLLREEALLASWRDMVDAPQTIVAVSYARLLLALAHLRGDSPDSLADRVCRILRDSYRDITRARGNAPKKKQDGEYPRRGEASCAERLQLAEASLSRLPLEAEVVVWLLYALGPKMQPPVLEVGEKVTLFDAKWLGRAMDRPENAAYPVPDELKAEGLARLLVARAEKYAQEDPDPVTRVAARFDLGRVRLPDAEEMARSSAEALIALASLAGGHSCPWIVEESFSMFIDGRDGPWSMMAPAVFTPTSAQHRAMREDRTVEVITKNVGRWGPHFPIRDEQMQEAAHLLVWLRKAREAWGPARLILCDRVIERASGWAGLSGPRRLIDDHLKLDWAINSMRNECANVAWDAYATGDVFEPVRDQAECEDLKRARNEIRWNPDLAFDLGVRSWTVRPRGTLQSLDWLIERVPEKSPISERLLRLKDDTATGRAGVAWAERLMEEFSKLEARSRRVRNSLVHGGPAIDQASSGALPFVEALAESALFISVEGRLDGVDLVDHFLERRAWNLKCLAALRAGVSPIDALWPNQDPMNSQA